MYSTTDEVPTSSKTQSSSSFVKKTKKPRPEKDEKEEDREEAKGINVHQDSSGLKQGGQTQVPLQPKKKKRRIEQDEKNDEEQLLAVARYYLFSILTHFIHNPLYSNPLYIVFF